jgi:hypothetical protein
VTSEVTRRAGRVAAIALLAALISIVWLGVVQPILTFKDAAAEERGIALRALKRNRALLREDAAIQAAEASVEQSARWRNFYDGPKAEAATLQLETDLRTIFRDSNNPTSMIAEPAISRAAVTRIAVRVTLTMRVDQLADALDRLQKQPRQLRVESLTIQAPEFQGAQANPILTIQAEITALMLAPGAART